MFKSLIKKICFKIYQIGNFENLRIEGERRKAFLNSMAELHDSTWISEDCSLHNNSKDKSKMRIGSNSRIMGQLFIFDFDGEIVIGDDCFVGPDTRIWSARKISIGNRVLIAHNVNIHDNISHPLNARDRYQENLDFVKTGMHKDYGIKGEEINIGNDVWIGFNTTILRGVTIGNGAIIGAGSLVTKDVEPWTVNVGNPLKCIQKLEAISV